MSKFVAKSFLGLATASAFFAVFSALTPSVGAFKIIGNSVENITADDLEKSFIVFLGGQIDGKSQEGLSSEATFKLVQFETVTKKIKGVLQEFTQVSFDILLSNTSSNAISSSRTSSLGFDVSDPILDAKSAGTDASTAPLFTNANLSTKLFDGKNGDVDLCFSDNRNNCRGGKNGGVKPKETGSFSASFTLSPSAKEIALSNFGVRYQSIDLANTKKLDDESGTGYAVNVAPNGSKNWTDSKDSHLW
ncbi:MULTISPECIES: cistern family PEP-CTERM protein [unclassified Coleofasciculus]|uniref:cistern family PEP-CTERM protein n=1 Tax=unclassified Coleofasciculus TaxID=2692782 RepID=UPI00187F88C5|nr:MULTISPECIES: cistern family PEP-CTERM protein [unclassified Coleofasciculus]MBE9125790.1 cistern family PEP-CTERM protein [Coleofasciculus sp. LEGE 07081]MBE9148463.1 cistern family PEP-CTERM protein [Coleofasciculus sp. LEGE 07092]